MLNKEQSMICGKVFTAVGLILVLTSCDSLPNPAKEAQRDKAIAKLEDRVSQLERQAALVPSQSNARTTGDWIMWYQEEGINAGYPQAQSAYSSKENCLAAAGQWTIPNGKLAANDPVIIRNKSQGIILRCLPTGIDPIQRH